MKHYIRDNNIQIDLNKVRYDLALIYVQEKFRYNLEHDLIPDFSPQNPHPKYLDEAQYLIDEFSTIFLEYFDMSEKDILEKLDFTYGADNE